MDLDVDVESIAGKSIREIFEHEGEKAFRDLETTCLGRVSERTGEVVALGGGAILREHNRDLINGSGICIWLDAEAETLSNRIYGDESSQQRRPALTELGHLDEILQLLASRKPLYQAVSQHRIDSSNMPPTAIADQILTLVKLNGK